MIYFIWYILKLYRYLTPRKYILSFTSEGAKHGKRKHKPLRDSRLKKRISGFWITSHNAKVMKAGLDANKAPFLPDQNGNIKAEPVYTLSQGYCLPASRLIPVQFEKMKKGYESNIVATRNQIGEVGTELKDGEKGVLYNFKGKDENFHTAAVFFPEQTENPEVILEMAKDKINQPTNLKGLSLTIESAEPVEYLGSYIAACKSGMNLSVSPEIAEDFKKNIMVNVNNDLKKAENRDKSIDSVGNILFNADRRGTEILKTLAFEQNQNSSMAPKKQESEMEMIF